MAADKNSAAHVEDLIPQHEAQLTGAIALASLFSSCVEAFNLIHPSSQKWDKTERLLLTRLGLQQARLLIWGSVLGVSSPPASVTDRAVPKHPSSAYPDLTEPTFFDPRDPRLDEPQVRTTIEQTLSALVDRSTLITRDEMMAKYGLKPPKRFTSSFEPAMDFNRLENFRERHELLKEVAESYAQINTRRNNSIIHTSWTIADIRKFAVFVKLTQEKVDYLIELMDIKEKVDRGMRMDIRVFGWHISPDRARTAMDISKLRLLAEICQEDYPEYLVAIQQALDNINRENRENAMPAPTILAPEQTSSTQQHRNKKRPGLFKIFRSFAHKNNPVGIGQTTSESLEDPGPERSQSDAGPMFAADDNDGETLGRVRSKSVGGYNDSADLPVIDEVLRNKLEKMSTQEALKEASDVTIDSPLQPHVFVPELMDITRHDQYHGIARVATKDLTQPGGNFATR